ncbi:MAG: DUF3990 domain-containing protein [Bacteroidales bacterium]|nr:DUF3990 domain-containing protein [Bacteroidales bacterium]
MNITVYHVSTEEIKKPSVDVNGENLGFGKGFYLTNSKIEAEALARKMSDKAIVNVYEFNYFKTKNVGYRFNEFETYNREWLNFVVDCRKGKDISADYDIVIAGGIYDDIEDIISDYEKNNITVEQAVEQLRYKDVKFQICILNQEIIDFNLEFMELLTVGY